ncbi:hypothetical protein CEXT_294801 [Caerostris extrusa]|uniref:Uncharacterized protein n=1 Tax=Caerostris extrusa TaxID=172846 RepID=A0AAV4PCT4_CAEEX|nr:hypothetical protein CEXT_294801 [Caerostris extrusa]
MAQKHVAKKKKRKEKMEKTISTSLTRQIKKRRPSLEYCYWCVCSGDKKIRFHFIKLLTNDPETCRQEEEERKKMVKTISTSLTRRIKKRRPSLEYCY